MLLNKTNKYINGSFNCQKVLLKTSKLTVQQNILWKFVTINAPSFFLCTSKFFVSTSQKGENLPKGLFVFSTPDQTLFKKYVQEKFKIKIYAVRVRLGSKYFFWD